MFWAHATPAAEAPGKDATPAVAVESSGDVTAGRRLLAVGAAVVPGAVVHGSGHFVLGRKDAAAKLLAMEGLGVGAILAGGIPIVLSGASRYIVGPAAVLVVGGFGLFSISWLADLYGAAVPDDLRGQPLVEAPMLQAKVGYLYVQTPQFDYQHFVHQHVSLWLDRWRFVPEGWFALDDENARMRLLAAHRLWGPIATSAGEPALDGSFLDLETAITHHRYSKERFESRTLELAVGSRLDLDRIAPDLVGSFGELGVGWALQQIDYDLERAGSDLTQLLLVRFAFGTYLDTRGSEFSLYYDHRHDGYAAGLKLSGLGSGVAGHFGTKMTLYPSQEWGVQAEAELGSAHVIGLSALFRPGDGR